MWGDGALARAKVCDFREEQKRKSNLNAIESPWGVNRSFY